MNQTQQPSKNGCWNQPRPKAGAIVTGSPAYGSQQWPFVNSTDCRYDMRETDRECAGCAERGKA